MEKDNNELFTTMPVGRAAAKLALPTVVSQIIVILYSLADTFFVGQLGNPNQIAALSITFPIYTLLTAVANLFGIGANSVISRSLGQNDIKTAKRASSFSFWGSILVTLVLSVLLGVSSPFIPSTSPWRRRWPGEPCRWASRQPFPCSWCACPSPC